MPPTRNSSATLGPTIFDGKRKVTLLIDIPEPELKKAEEVYIHSKCIYVSVNL